MTALKPYPAYRPTDLPWLGQIPAHWEVKRLKFIFQVANGATPSSSVPAYWGGNIVWVTPDDLGKLEGDTLTQSGRSITKEGYQNCGTTLVPANSIVLSTRAPIGHLAIAGVELCTNQGCRSLVFKKEQNTKFFYFVLQAIKTELQARGTGTTFQELSKSNLENTELVLPPLAEQRTIAAYLDRQTAKIDALIAKQRRLLDLLAEKRAALISQAVTKGLNPRAEMKDSGVAWLGEIPKHWEVEIVKRHFDIDLGKMLNSANQSEKGFMKPYLRAANIFWEGVWLGDVNKMEFTNQQLKRYRLQKGDLLVTEGGVTVGRSAIWQGELDEVYYQNSINRARPKGSVPVKFLYYWLYSLKLNGVIDVIADKATFGHLTKEKLQVLPMTVPQIDEAEKITKLLDIKLAQIARIQEKIETIIARLQEYRAALISAVVTGKLQVAQTTENLKP